VNSPAEHGWDLSRGRLASYGPGVIDSFKGLAKFVTDPQGADASKVAIEQVSRILLTINMQAARRIGLTCRHRSWSGRRVID